MLLNGLPVSTFTGTRWLGVTVDGGTEITPRTRIGSVPFALNAQNAQVAEAVAWSGLTGVPGGFSDNIDNTTSGLGSAGAGQVAVYDSANTVAGNAGLTASGSSLTVGGGLNVGTSGAALGDVRLSGRIAQSTATGARVYNSANILANHGTVVTLTFNQERFDTANLHSTASNTSRLTAPVAGVYAIHGTVRFEATANLGVRALTILLNGVTELAGQNVFPAANASTAVAVSTLYYLNTGDYVTLAVFQNSGVDLNITPFGNRSLEFSMVRVP